MLSGGTPRDLMNAIASADTARFQAVPGIGKRTAERIIVELREKVAGKTGIEDDIVITRTDDPRTLAREGLVGLGYSSQEADKLLDEVERRHARGPDRRRAEGDAVSGGIRTPGVERIQAAPEVAGDEELDRSLRPRRLDDFVGQQAVRDQLGVFIDAARARGEALDHVLLAGPPGLGKTSLAQIVAAELDAPFVQTAGPALERKGDIAAFLTALEPRSVFFVDEIHRLPRALEETFYPAMEDRRLPITVGQGAGARVVTLDLPPFTLVGATTRAGLITTPLRDRFGVTFRLDLYDPDDLAAIVLRSARHPRRSTSTRRARGRSPSARAAPRASPTGCSSACATSPRCAARGHVDAAVAAEALDMLEVDELGLDRLDREILRTICEKFDGGPVGPVDARGGGLRGAGHARGRLRALPAPARPDQAHAARPRGHRGGVRPPRAGAPGSRG